MAESEGRFSWGENDVQLAHLMTKDATGMWDGQPVPNSTAVQEADELPTPKEGESEQDFVSRCMPIVRKEGLDEKAALGKCYGIYRNAKKEAAMQQSQAQKGLRKAAAVFKVLLATKADLEAPSMGVDPMELYEGTIEELEHTDDWKVAFKLALDHLMHDPDWYAKAGAAGLVDNPNPELPSLDDEPVSVQAAIDYVRLYKAANDEEESEAEKCKKRYVNSEGKFHNGFDGCVEWAKNCRDLPEARAKALCGYINSRKG